MITQETVDIEFPIANLGMDSTQFLLEWAESDADTTRNDICNYTAGIGALLLRKNHSYGDSALEPPMFADEVPPSTAIMVRQSDKLKRLIQL